MSKSYKLNPSQKKFYKDNGYLLVENFIQESKAQKIKKYALNKLAEKPNYPINLNVHRKDKVFFKIISDKNLVKIVNDLQKSKVVALNDQMIYKKRKQPMQANLGQFIKTILILGHLKILTLLHIYF